MDRIPNTNSPEEVRRAFEKLHFNTDGLTPTTISHWNSAYVHKTTEDALNGLVKCNGSGTYSAIVDNSTNWNTAYGWGNHASAGYSLTNGTLPFTGTVGGVDPVASSDLATKNYVDTVIQEVIYTPSSLTVNNGDDVTGTVTDVQTLSDGNTLHVGEVTGVPGYNVEFNFLSVASFSRVWLHVLYTGLITHTVNVDLWNYDTSAWVNITTFTTSAALQFKDIIVDDTHYIDGSGNAKLRIYHVTTGINTHEINIDYVALAQSGLGSSNEHGALVGLSDDDHTQYHTDARAVTWLAAGHETTYNHANYNTAYGWGDHSTFGYISAEYHPDQFWENIGVVWSSLGQQASQDAIYALCNLENGIALSGTYNDGHILRSVDYGLTWTDLGQQGSEDRIVSLVYLENGIALAGSGPGGRIYRSTNYGLTWTDLGNLYSANSIDGLLYLGNGICLAGSSPSGRIFRSTDYGATWANLGAISTQTTVYSFAYLGNGIVVAGTGTGGRIYRSTDYGATWSNLGQQASESYIRCFTYLGNGICLAGTGTFGKILRSVDYGTTWSDLGQQSSQGYIYSLIHLGNGVCLAGTSTGGLILRSVDYGLTWPSLGQQAAQASIYSFAYLGSGVVVAGTSATGLILRNAVLGTGSTGLYTPLAHKTTEDAINGLVSVDGAGVYSAKVIGTDVQAYNAGLADIASLAKTDSNIIVGNGTNWIAESGATARTSLGLGTGNSPAFTGLTLSGLTIQRVPYATTGGQLIDSSNLTYDGTTLVQYSRTINSSYAEDIGAFSDPDLTLYISTTGNDDTGNAKLATPWATLGKAIEWLTKVRIAPGITVTILMGDGIWTINSSITWSHPDGDKIIITGTYYEVTINSIQSVAGSSGNYTIILNLASVSGITTDHYIKITAPTGGTNPTYLRGVWQITNVDAINSRITITSTIKGATTPSGAVTGLAQILKTTLYFPNQIGFINGNTLQLRCLLLKGNGGDYTKWGVFQNIYSVLQNGLAVLYAFGISGFGCGVYGSGLLDLYACALSNNGYGVIQITNPCSLNYTAITGNTYGFNPTSVVFSNLSSSILGNTTDIYYTDDPIKAGPLYSASLTSGRIVYSTTSGLLTDSANLTFDGTKATLTSAAGIIETIRNSYNNAINSGSYYSWYAGVTQTASITHYLDASIRGNTYFQTFNGSSLVESLRLRGNQAGFGVADPSAVLHLKAGTATAGTGPLKFTSGTLNTTAEVGTLEFLTDDIYFTITTGAARQKIALTAGLTSGRVPYATTNGRLTDAAALAFDGTTLSSTKFAGYGIAPIGSILAWLKSYTNTPALPSGWVECNGQTLSDADSVYNGQVIPDLNGGNRFLRGNSTSGGTGGESTHTLTTDEMPSHSHTVSSLTSAGPGPDSVQHDNASSAATINTSTTGSGDAHENKPPYYDVVWIMRVK